MRSTVDGPWGASALRNRTFLAQLCKTQNSLGFAKEVVPRKAVDSSHLAFELSQYPCIAVLPFVFENLEPGHTFDEGQSLFKRQIK